MGFKKETKLPNFRKLLKVARFTRLFSKVTEAVTISGVGGRRRLSNRPSCLPVAQEILWKGML